MRLMDMVLVDALVFSRAYMDDVVVFSFCWSDHYVHLDVVLQKLLDINLTSKCEWGIVTCTYIGFIVGQGKRRPEDCKVNAVHSFYLEWVLP